MSGRVPPNDADAEAAVISAMLLDRAALDVVMPILKPDDFYSEANRRIFEAIFWLAEQSQPVDTVTVAGRLRDTERFAQVGGSTYLVHLTDFVPSIAHIDTYAEKVREKSTIRKLIAACQKVAAEGYGDYGDAKHFIDAAEQSIFDLARVGRKAASEYVGPVMRRVITDLVEMAKRGERIAGTPSGFERLDSKTAGLHEGDVTIVAARPGMGKTSLVVNIAVNVASPKMVPRNPHADYIDTSDLVEVPGDGVLFWSLEMPREQLATRMACSEGRVDVGKMRQGFLQDRDWDNLTRASQFIDKLPILINDTSGATILDIRAEARRFESELERRSPKQKLGLICIDYLQLMTAAGEHGSREQEISSISRALKGLAKELKVPVIALSQLNRAVETRGKDKRPQLSDLRESGAIEQDADNIIFIYRDDYYEADSERRGLAELIVAKQRNGPTGKVLVRWSDAYTRFDNLQVGEFDEEEYAA